MNYSKTLRSCYILEAEQLYFRLRKAYRKSKDIKCDAKSNYILPSLNF